VANQLDLQPLPPDGPYAPLISVDLSHDYCNAAGGKFEGIAIAPTPVTARRLSRYGLLLRRRTDGIDLFLNKAQSDALTAFIGSLSADLREDVVNDLFGAPMLFTMQLKSDLFFNYTEVPTGIRSGKPALMLTNRRSKVVGERTASLVIDWGEKFTVEPAEPPPVAPMADLKPAKTETLPPSLREKIEVKLASGDGDQDEYEPLSGWWMESSGQIASATEERKNLESCSRHLPFGLLRISAMPPKGRKSSGWNGYPVDITAQDGQYLQPTRYLIQFPARQTYWRYWIADRGGALDHSKLAISDPAGIAGFGDAEPDALPDGTKASCFTATRKLPLKQRPDAVFALRGTTASDGGRERELIARLPAPTPESILPDPHPPPGRTRSDIFIFV